MIRWVVCIKYMRNKSNGRNVPKVREVLGFAEVCSGAEFERDLDRWKERVDKFSGL